MHLHSQKRSHFSNVIGSLNLTTPTNTNHATINNNRQPTNLLNLPRTHQALQFEMMMEGEVAVTRLDLAKASTVLYCTVLYCTVLYCTVLYCTVWYCIVLHCITKVAPSAQGWYHWGTRHIIQRKQQVNR